MTDLIEKLKQADGASRELDYQVFGQIHPDFKVRFDGVYLVYKKTGLAATDEVVAPVTASIDAALALMTEVNPELTWRMTKLNLCFAEIQNHGSGRPFTGLHKSPAIAILIALLEALSAKEKG